ncbi:LuxR C-terminal-related transcriptional regulator [Streptomyces sp. NPDC001054]
MTTYRRVAEGEKAAPPDVRALQIAGLVEPAPLGVTLRDPRAVGHSRMAAAMEAIAEAAKMLRTATEVVEEMPALEALHHHYDKGRFFGGQASEFLGTRAEMNDRLLAVSELADQSFWAAQPGAPVERDPEIVALGTARSVRALGRGIQVRTLYNRLVREHAQAREAAEAVVDAGGEARTLPPYFPRMVIIDAKHLFVDNLVGPGDRDSGWHITDPAAVAWARNVFQHAWDRATPWAKLVASAAGRITERQRQILDLLAAGQTQCQITARLGLSERTVTKELAAVREGVGMATTFQVMAWWGAQREGRA